MDEKKPLSKNIYLGRDVVTYLEERAKKEDRSVSWLVKHIIEKEMIRDAYPPISILRASVDVSSK